MRPRPSRRTPAGALLLVGACAACVTGGGTPASPDPALAANATISGVLDEPFELSDGRYEGPPATPTAASRPYAVLLPDRIASGDLDGDGVRELAAIIVAGFGGSGSFVHLVILDARGDSARSVAALLLGDRVRVERIGIAEGVVEVETVEHLPGDSMCCPTARRHRRFGYRDGGVVSLDGQVVRGHVTLGHEVRVFEECGTGREAWLIDRTGGELARVAGGLSTGSFPRVFAEVVGQWGPAPQTGFGVDYGGSLTVTALVRAENEGPGCTLDTEAFDFDLRGNEPTWRLTVDGTEMHFATMGADPVEATASWPEPSPGTVRLAGRVNDDTIDVLLETARCRDTMSGAVYSLTAAVTIGSREFRGCAIAGRQWRSKLTPSSSATDGS